MPYQALGGCLGETWHWPALDAEERGCSDDCRAAAAGRQLLRARRPIRFSGHTCCTTFAVSVSSFLKRTCKRARSGNCNKVSVGTGQYR